LAGGPVDHEGTAFLELLDLAPDVGSSTLPHVLSPSPSPTLSIRALRSASADIARKIAS
jgi:hypothetical protein